MKLVGNRRVESEVGQRVAYIRLTEAIREEALKCSKAITDDNRRE